MKIVIIAGLAMLAGLGTAFAGGSDPVPLQTRTIIHPVDESECGSLVLCATFGRVFNGAAETVNHKLATLFEAIGARTDSVAPLIA